MGSGASQGPLGPVGARRGGGHSILGAVPKRRPLGLRGTHSPEPTLVHVHVSNATDVGWPEGQGYFCDAGQLAGFQGAASPGASGRRRGEEEGGRDVAGGGGGVGGGRTAQRCRCLWRSGTFPRKSEVRSRRGSAPRGRGPQGKDSAARTDGRTQSNPTKDESPREAETRGWGQGARRTGAAGRPSTPHGGLTGPRETRGAVSTSGPASTGARTPNPSGQGAGSPPR